MWISFHRSMGKNFRSTVIGIAQILHCETDTAGFVLLFKEFYCMILAVIFLRHFHDIHQTSGRDRERNRGRNQAREGVYGACQCSGKRQKHGHGSVTDRIAPYTVNSPSVTAVGYDKTNDRHQDRGQDRHSLEFQTHADIVFLERFEPVRIKMDQIKCLDRLDIGESLLIETIHFGIHGSTFLVVVPHSAQQRTRHQGTERDTEKCKQGKGRIVIQNNRKSTDEPEGIDDQVWYPVQNTAGNIGSIRAPAGNKVTGVIFRQRFPVRDEHFCKNIVLDLGVNLKTDKG